MVSAQIISLLNNMIYASKTNISVIHIHLFKTHAPKEGCSWNLFHEHPSLGARVNY